jgi:hypothetical protein
MASNPTIAKLPSLEAAREKAWSSRAYPPLDSSVIGAGAADRYRAQSSRNVRVLFHQTAQQVLSDYSISLFKHPHLFRSCDVNQP